MASWLSSSLKRIESVLEKVDQSAATQLGSQKDDEVDPSSNGQHSYGGGGGGSGVGAGTDNSRLHAGRTPYRPSSSSNAAQPARKLDDDDIFKFLNDDTSAPAPPPASSAAPAHKASKPLNKVKKHAKRPSAGKGTTPAELKVNGRDDDAKTPSKNMSPATFLDANTTPNPTPNKPDENTPYRPSSSFASTPTPTSTPTSAPFLPTSTTPTTPPRSPEQRSVSPVKYSPTTKLSAESSDTTSSLHPGSPQLQSLDSAPPPSTTLSSSSELTSAGTIPPAQAVSEDAASMDVEQNAIPSEADIQQHSPPSSSNVDFMHIEEKRIPTQMEKGGRLL